MRKSRYLVCRMDAIRPHGSMRTSEHFPTIVEVDSDGPVLDYEDIVKEAFKNVARSHGSSRYIGLHDYIVVHLGEAKIVSFREPQRYEVEVREFDY